MTTKFLTALLIVVSLTTSVVWALRDAAQQRADERVRMLLSLNLAHTEASECSSYLENVSQKITSLNDVQLHSVQTARRLLILFANTMGDKKEAFINTILNSVVDMLVENSHVDMKSVGAFRSLFDDNQKENVDNRDIQSTEDIMRYVNSQMSRLDMLVNVEYAMVRALLDTLASTLEEELVKEGMDLLDKLHNMGNISDHTVNGTALANNATNTMNPYGMNTTADQNNHLGYTFMSAFPVENTTVTHVGLSNQNASMDTDRPSNPSANMTNGQNVTKPMETTTADMQSMNVNSTTPPMEQDTRGSESDNEKRLLEDLELELLQEIEKKRALNRLFDYIKAKRQN